MNNRILAGLVVVCGVAGAMQASAEDKVFSLGTMPGTPAWKKEFEALKALLPAGASVFPLESMNDVVVEGVSPGDLKKLGQEVNRLNREASRAYAVNVTVLEGQAAMWGQGISAVNGLESFGGGQDQRAYVEGCAQPQKTAVSGYFAQVKVEPSPVPGKVSVVYHVTYTEILGIDTAQSGGCLVQHVRLDPHGVQGTMDIALGQKQELPMGQTSRGPLTASITVEEMPRPGGQ